MNHTKKTGGENIEQDYKMKTHMSQMFLNRNPNMLRGVQSSCFVSEQGKDADGGTKTDLTVTLRANQDMIMRQYQTSSSSKLLLMQRLTKDNISLNQD